MSQTYILRRQHDALANLADQLRAAIKTCKTELDAQDCARKLDNLTGVLALHTAGEDHALYPQMMASNDPLTAETAHRFAREMGGLAAAYKEYHRKWRMEGAIFADIEGFRIESEIVCNALAYRTAREEAELYPLADRICEQSAVAA